MAKLISLFFDQLRDREPRENREDRSSGVGRGGVELFRPRGAIGRGPEGP